MLVELLKADAVTKMPDGGLRRVTNDMPKDAKAVRAWVGEQGDIHVTFESETVCPVPEGCRMEERRVTCHDWRQRDSGAAAYEQIFQGESAEGVSELASLPTITESGEWLLKVYTMEKCVWLRNDGMVLRTWYYPRFGGTRGEEYRLLWSGPFPPSVEPENLSAPER